MVLRWAGFGTVEIIPARGEGETGVYLVVGCDDGRLYAFREKPGKEASP